MPKREGGAHLQSWSAGKAHVQHSVVGMPKREGVAHLQSWSAGKVYIQYERVSLWYDTLEKHAYILSQTKGSG